MAIPLELIDVDSQLLLADGQSRSAFIVLEGVDVEADLELVLLFSYICDVHWISYLIATPALEPVLVVLGLIGPVMGLYREVC